VTITDNRGLFGTTASSGLSGFSTAYEFSLPIRNGQLTLTTLQKFGTGFDSNQPRGGLVRGKAAPSTVPHRLMREAMGSSSKLLPSDFEGDSAL